MLRLSSLGLLALLLGLAGPSQALFGDEEARKAIVDLREQVAQLQKEHNARIDELSQRIDRIDNLVQAIQRGQLEAGAQFDSLHQELAKRSVYFDFDKSLIKGEYQPLVEAHGRYLVEHTARQIRIEGNCDERGGREYNLALGQRRADAVRERMELVGVAATRIETISFGKEKPKALGHDEAAWVENRRADLVYR